LSRWLSRGKSTISWEEHDLRCSLQARAALPLSANTHAYLKHPTPVSSMAIDKYFLKNLYHTLGLYSISRMQILSLGYLYERRPSQTMHMWLYSATMKRD
ncbi:hypothetical protein BX616_008792, partial [Lobosporangium transversale]